MDLMNEQEYTQACLFRIREALATTKAWWESNLSLNQHKINRTINMLQDTIDELKYFSEKIGDYAVEAHVRETVTAGLYER